MAPKLVPLSAPANLKQGDRTTLTCTVARGDSPLTLLWKKDGAPVSVENLPSVKILNFDEFNSMLTIESLSISHIGNYSCSAVNLAGNSALSTHINVHGKQTNMAGKFKNIYFFVCSSTCFSAIQFRHDFLLWLFSVLCTDFGSSNPGALRVDPRRHASQIQLA